MNQQTPHIKHVYIKGYKSLRDTSIDLSEGLNIVIGQNGSGKTNFVNAIVEMLWENCNEIGAQTHLQVSVDTVFDINMEVIEGNFMEIRNATSTQTSNQFNVRVDKTHTVGINHVNVAKIEELRKVAYNLPFPNLEKIKIVFRPQPKVQASPIITCNYFGLIMIIQHNFYTNADFYQNPIIADESVKKDILKIPIDLIKNLSSCSPIQDLRFDIKSMLNFTEYENIVYDNIQLQFKIENKWLYWQQLSDGTKRLFYLITEIYLTQAIVLIEEPELGIHPHQLHDLMQFIKKQAETKQIIVTTHSPQVLNILNSEELHKIVVCETNENGTKMRHLTPKQIKNAQKYMSSELSLGDYWLHADLEPKNMLL